MGYAELIEKLQNLPEEKRAEVLDFVDFLASRQGHEPRPAVKGGGALAAFRSTPFFVEGFRPLSREEANAR